MQLGYSTVEQGEILDALTKVNELVGFDRLDDDASRGGTEVVRMPSNDNCDQGGSTENPTQNQ
jgi:hypothetical protein